MGATAVVVPKPLLAPRMSAMKIVLSCAKRLPSGVSKNHITSPFSTVDTRWHRRCRALREGDLLEAHPVATL